MLTRRIQTGTRRQCLLLGRKRIWRSWKWQTRHLHLEQPGCSRCSTRWSSPQIRSTFKQQPAQLWIDQDRKRLLLGAKPLWSTRQRSKDQLEPSCGGTPSKGRLCTAFFNHLRRWVFYMRTDPNRHNVLLGRQPIRSTRKPHHHGFSPSSDGGRTELNNNSKLLELHGWS